MSRPRTQPDPPRMSAQVKGSPFNSVGRWQTPKTAPGFPDTEEATSSNLVPPSGFSNVCLAGGVKRGAQGGARSQPDPAFF